MATQEQIKAISGLYVAYFNRAADPEGLQFWIDQLDGGRDFATISQDFATSAEATEIYPFLATPDLVSSSPAAFVTSIFANLFGRAPDQAGLDFWVGVIASGAVAPGDMVEAVLLGAQDTLVFGEQVLDKTTVENKVIAACHFVDEINANVPDYVFDAEGYTAAQESIAGVTADVATVDVAALSVQGYVGSFAPQSLFTLQTPTVVIDEATAGEQVTQTLLYWGYNPHGHDETDGVDNLDGNDPTGNDNGLTNEGPEDGGIPISEFFAVGGYLDTILGFDLAEIVAVDANTETNGLPTFDTVRDITITAGDAGTGTLSFIDANGTADDIAISAEYFELLNNILFDEEGNTRFFEKEVAARLPVYVDTNGNTTTVPQFLNINGATVAQEPIGYIDAFVGATGEVTAEMPIVLTTTANNGSTLFPGFTSDDNDTIVAGRLDMLHQAIIDGGEGINTLEVDAKGHFAQPQQLTNIQEINITNLPNIYTFEDDDDGSGADDGNGSQYPDVVGDDASDLSAGDNDSIIDLSRAIDLENVTIAEGDYAGLDASTNEPGDITVTGLRNDATLTLQGNLSTDVYVRTGTGNTADGFTVILQNVNQDGDLEISDNSTKLNLVSEGGGNQIDSISSHNNDSIIDLVISGSAKLFIEDDLSRIFDGDTPGTIDASANTAGVDLNISGNEQMTFHGSTSDDRFAISTNASDSTDQNGDFNNDESVTIVNTGGDNYYDIGTFALDVTEGDGDNNIEFIAADATITVGKGDNHLEGEAVQVEITAGDGDNKFDVLLFDGAETTLWATEDDYPTALDLTTGNGSNIINVLVEGDTTGGGNTAGFGGQFRAVAEINITAGDGGNLIQVPALPFALNGVLSAVTVNTGSGADNILVGASDITINSGGGGDTLTLLGIDNDYVTAVNEDNEFEAANVGATLNIDTGAGAATINLGADIDDAFLVSGAIIAKEGSSITGADVTIFVNTVADLRAADLSGITSIVMDDDSFGYSGQGFSGGINADGDPSAASSLTLLDTQVAALGEAVFSTQGQTFGAQSVLTIVVTQDATLSTLLDLSAWNDSVKLSFVVEDGVTLTLSAEELHKYVAPDGIFVTNTNGFIDNQVIVTDAGPDFDAYDSGQNGGINGGSVQGDASTDNDVTVLYTPDGYERPEEDPSNNLIQWNSDDTPVIDETVYPFATDMTIEGAADLTVTAPIILGDNFTVDFSDFAGDFTMTTNGVETLTIANFQALTEATNFNDWGQITGNGTDTDPVRIDFLLSIGNVDVPSIPMVGDLTFGVLNGGLPSTGVQQYVLTAFHDDDANIQSQAGSFSAVVVVCDKTEDLEVLGLQNNRNSDVTFEQVNWGTEILFEGDGYANSSDQEKNLGNPDLSEVGFIAANFFESGANAVVRVTNQGVELGQDEDTEDGFTTDGERVLDVAGVTLTNADRLLLAVEDGDAVINAVNGDDLERIIVTGPEDVKIIVDGIDGADGSGLNADNLVSIDASGVVGEFALGLTGDVDLSGVTLTGVDSIMLIGDVDLTLTADQVIELGGLITNDGAGVTTLNVVEYEGEAIDFGAIEVSNIGTITTSDVDGTIDVDAAADFGDADSFIILAEETDTGVQMTAAQFGTITGGDVDMEEGAGTDGTLILTDVPADDEITLTNVTADADGDGVADIELRGSDFVSTEDFMITDGAGGNSATHFITAVLEGGVNDITETPIPQLLDLDCLLLEDGAVLTLTAAQLEVLHTFAEELKIADGANVTINITDLSDQELDLDTLVEDNPGLTIGTITIEDNDTAITINPLTTFGGAAEIITPTADVTDPVDGLEDTSVTMSVAQFLSSGGSITGDGMINLTGLANNNDSDADFELDNALIDTSGITAPTGTISLFEDGPIPAVGETVTLNELTDLSGFEILLTDGQLIRFSTEAQASGATITDEAVLVGNPVGVVWLFDTWSGTEIDTTGYDSNIDTLFVDEDLVNGQNEEAIWNTLPGSIVVQKFNDEAPKGLVVTVRQNTFEVFGSALDGITFDDQNEFQTTGALILKLEGNVTIGDITIADTLGGGAFDFLEISSTFDEENNPADANVIIQPNKVGDIFLNAPQANGLSLEVLLDTSDDQDDVAFANGTTGAGNVADTDDGLALEVGTIFLGAPATDVNFATVSAVGDHDITIEGIDYSDANLTQVDVQTDGFDFFGSDLTINSINIGDLSELMGLTGAPDAYVILNDFTADALTDLDSGLFTPTAGDEEIILAVDGDVDLSELGDGDDVFDVDGIHGLSAGTLTLTADQVFAIGTADGADADTAADAWILGPGVAPNDITINVTGLSGQILDLDAIRDAGFNIGTITIVAPGADLDFGTTLGGADMIVLDINDADGEVILELSAEQYNQLADGTIVEDREADADPDTDIGTVIIDNLVGIEDDTSGEATIDVSNVSTTGNNTFWLGEEGDENPSALDDNDTTFSAASILDPADPAFSAFSVTLADLDSTGAADELAGQTIRFSTEVQADGRVVLVVGEDGPSKDEQDTNLVWLFDAVTGGLDASGYDANIGRIWISDVLVDSVGGDVDGLWTIPNPENPASPLFTLDSNIIKRIETEDLTPLLELNVGINQRVEITSFTNIAGAEFEIDDPLISITNLRIDMGGATDINDLVLDNILGPVDPTNSNFPGDDNFETLTINSLIANGPDHYLLPDSWTDAIPLPSDDLQIANQSNTVGDISSGDDRGVLNDVVINTFDADPTDTGAGGTDEGPADFLGALLGAAEVEGADFVAETIFFSDDGDTTAVGGDAGTPTATLTVTGGNDVTLKSLDTSDADITGLVIDTIGHTGTLTVTGGSPAFDGDSLADDTTETLEITNGGSSEGVIQFASTITFDDLLTTPTPTEANNEFNIDYNVGAGETVPYSGVSSGALTSIDASLHGGTISLGVISQVNSELFTLQGSTTGGQVHARIGEGLDDGVVETPELSATGVWTVNGTFGGDPAAGGLNNLDLEIQAVTLNNGGQLALNSVDLCITGDVDLTPLDAADITFSGSVTLSVDAGATLTLSVEQAVAFAVAGLTITGEGTLAIVGDGDDADFDFLLGTATVDMSGVTITAADADDAVAYNAIGALDKAGDAVTQTIIGSAFNDAVTVLADDGDDGTIDVILQLGTDAGSIGDPLNTLTDGSPEADATEMTGDTIIIASGGQVQIEVDAGFDAVNTLRGDNASPTPADIVQVAAGAEFYAANVGDEWVAGPESTNDGVAVIENGTGDFAEAIDVSDAGGANGWTLIGSADTGAASGELNTLVGSALDDVLVDGAASGDDNDDEEDSFTGNAGADLFSFNVSSSTPATFVDTEVQAASDVEFITVTAAPLGADVGAALLTIEYELNNATTVAVVNDANAGFDVDFSDPASIAAGIAAVMDALPGITATVDIVTDTQVNLVGDNGNLLNINAITPNGAAGAVTTDFAADNLADDDADNTDDATDADDDDLQISEVEITGTVTEGEIYFLTVTLADGSEIEAQYEAALGDDVDDVAAGLITNGAVTGLNDIAAGQVVAAAGGAANIIEITDGDDDDGGFSVSLSAGQAVLNGSSSSSVLLGTEADLTEADADVVTDFLDDDDTITFGLDAGDNDNYDEAAYEDTFGLAQAAANAAFAGDADLIYFLTGTTDLGDGGVTGVAGGDGGATGLLFVNANNDGTADTVVSLTGVTEANFDDSNII